MSPLEVINPPAPTGVAAVGDPSSFPRPTDGDQMSATTGVQTLYLVVGDNSDGNQDDHGDWASPTLTWAD